MGPPPLHSLHCPVAGWQDGARPRGYVLSPDLHRLASRTRDDTGTWWGSKAAKKLDGATKRCAARRRKLGGHLFYQAAESGNHPNSPYALGFDFVNIFSFREYSMGVVSIRCEDLSPEGMAKRCFHLPLVIIPGPK